MDESILIVGAGTFGLSTALDLAQNGYRHITVLDRAPEIPSSYSAGCDLNKIVRAEYEDGFYTDLALEAIKAWKSPFFAPYYAETGLIIANSPSAEEKARSSLTKSFSSIAHHPGFPSGSFRLIGAGQNQDMRPLAPQITGSALDDWTGYFNKYGGYARASRAMVKIHSECERLGVRFILGEQQGHATRLLFHGKRCIGVETASGKEHKATRVILCLGAHVARLLPSIAPQIVAKAWSVAHLQLSQEQAKAMAGVPVVNCRDLGFFFEPDPETCLLKLCAHSAGLTNYETIAAEVDSQMSVPTSSGSSISDYRGRIPREDEDKIVKLIAATMPQFSCLPLTRKFICWCGDTADSNYIIDYVPNTDSRSLMVFSGDSGHAFKMLPIAGRWARQVLEKGVQELDRWKWKATPDGDTNDIHWRVGSVRDVKGVVDWVAEDECLHTNTISTSRL
ncbi:FAD dependent oxidoreductase [Ilyonectria robusta]|uniref:FAD dependent oxidoreductase n=1 Tax=Ilyonectria robusta TaxID=1079257 RepID=UPI001E8E2710|nr:FAD dependent oxidoreductase [Ilyonectria robusta]KAH8680436.1 FAD dependent oxidoreductase [Ilyonectria robusta]